MEKHTDIHHTPFTIQYDNKFKHTAKLNVSTEIKENTIRSFVVVDFFTRFVFVIFDGIISLFNIHSSLYAFDGVFSQISCRIQNHNLNHQILN